MAVASLSGRVARAALQLLVAAVVAGVLAAGFFAGSRPHGPGRPPDHPRELIGFTLTDRTGRTVTRAELRGTFCVVSFVSTGCGVICPIVSRQMAAVQRLAAGMDDVRLVSFTVDPRTDTPPVLAKFAARFGADTNRWLFLTGDKNVLFPLIETSFLPKDTLGGYQPMPGEFLDTDRIVLVDPQGSVRAYFDGMILSTPSALMAEVERLRARPNAR
jgi:protein SCO1